MYANLHEFGNEVFGQSSIMLLTVIMSFIQPLFCMISFMDYSLIYWSLYWIGIIFFICGLCFLYYLIYLWYIMVRNIGFEELTSAQTSCTVYVIFIFIGSITWIVLLGLGNNFILTSHTNIIFLIAFNVLGSIFNVSVSVIQGKLMWQEVVKSQKVFDILLYYLL